MELVILTAISVLWITQLVVNVAVSNTYPLGADCDDCTNKANVLTCDGTSANAGSCDAGFY